jgi:uncharacterized protein (DUF2062 family)
LIEQIRSRVRALVKKAMEEQATPPKVGLALALGVFVGSSPLVGLHSVVVVALASALRLNRTIAFLGSGVSVGPLFALFAVGEVGVGARLLGQSAPRFAEGHVIEAAKGALGAWWVGFAVVGPATALLAGLVGFALARRRAQRALRSGITR